MKQRDVPASPRVLIVAENASRQYGGEAALPVHYFEHLRRRGIATWLLTHARVRQELEEGLCMEQIIYVEDGWMHQLLWQLSKILPSRLEYLTSGFLSRLITQASQRRIAQRLVKELQIDIIHQPIPVSPKEPSLFYGLGVPVVIGPLNGGMEFPPGFSHADSHVTRLLTRGMRWLAHGLNALAPGKKQAALILVANQRTRQALPFGHSPNVGVLVENGVDLQLWRPADPSSKDTAPTVTRYVYMGRLVDVKQVNLLLDAFAQACKKHPMSLLIIGDGPLRADLQNQAEKLGILSVAAEGEGKVHFAGWMSQTDAAQRLQHQHCLILPSVRECGGAVVLEAMAASLPVIALDWGGPADYLDDACGILIDPKGPAHVTAELEHALVKLAQEPKLRQTLGRQGRAKVEQLFDWEKKIDVVVAMYQNAIESQSKGKNLLGRS